MHRLFTQAPQRLQGGGGQHKVDFHSTHIPICKCKLPRMKTVLGLANASFRVQPGFKNQNTCLVLALWTHASSDAFRLSMLTRVKGHKMSPLSQQQDACPPRMPDSVPRINILHNANGPFWMTLMRCSLPDFRRIIGMTHRGFETSTGALMVTRKLGF
jgi:hypothetical protein